MNLAIAMKVLIILTISIIAFNGCSGTKQIEIKEVYIPQKCITKKIERPEIDDTKYTNRKDVIAKALENVSALRIYSKELEAELEKCR